MTTTEQDAPLSSLLAFAPPASFLLFLVNFPLPSFITLASLSICPALSFCSDSQSLRQIRQRPKREACVCLLFITLNGGTGTYIFICVCLCKQVGICLTFLFPCKGPKAALLMCLVLQSKQLWSRSFRMFHTVRGCSRMLSKKK